MLTSFDGRLAPAPAPGVNLSVSLEGLENVIPPTSPLSLAGRPYYLRLDKPLPEKPLPATPLSMGYSTIWSRNSSCYGNSTRCSSRESSRYSKDTCPNLASSASDDELEAILHQHESIQVEPVGKDRVIASTASPDPLEVFLADDKNNSSNRNNDNDDKNDDVEDDEYEDEPEMSNSNSTATSTSSSTSDHEDEVELQSLHVRHTIIDWAHNQFGPNHYFREKKLDFFPELAPPNALASTGTWPYGPGRPASALQSRPPKKRNLSAFDFGKFNLTRGNTSNTLRRSLTDRSGMALANNVRSSIRSAVQRTLSKHSSLEKEKEKRRRQPRPSTAQRSARSATPATPSTPGTPATPVTPATLATLATRSGRSGSSRRSSSRPLQNYEDVISASLRMRSLSISPRSSTMDTLPVRRPRPLAVPPSPYQKYGAAIWEKPAPLRLNQRRVSRNNIGPHVRFPRYYQNHRRWSSSFVSGSSTSSLTNKSDQLTQTQSNPVLPVSVSPPLRSLSLSLLQRNTRGYIKALQNSTSNMLGALDDAKQRVIAARVDRRRAHLKAQIRLVGPVDPNRAHEGIHPWV